MCRTIDIKKRFAVKDLLLRGYSVREIMKMVNCRPGMITEIRKTVIQKLNATDMIEWIKKLNPVDCKSYAPIVRNNQGRNARPSHVKEYWDLFQAFQKSAKP
jgi:hypothetical protein